MQTPKYILAKYVPDLTRMEPRNIGVIVWSNGKFCAKFLESKEALAVDVNELHTYERWTAYWSRLIQQQEIRPRRGKPVSLQDSSCLDALISTQKGNYLLVDAGELLQPIRKAELSEVVEYLFNDLVATRDRLEKSSRKSFQTVCDSTFKKAGVDYISRAPVPCSFRGITRTLHPDYYVGNGSPDAIFQRTTLSKESSVNSSAMLVHSLLDQGIIEQHACRFLIRSEDITSENAEAAVSLCERLCGVIDINDRQSTNEIRNISLTTHRPGTSGVSFASKD